MKRLHLISLMGLMLISQAHASDLITRESAIALSKGAGLGLLLPLVARGLPVMIKCAQAEREDINHCKANIMRNKPATIGCANDRTFEMPSSLYYLSPGTNIINRLLRCYGPWHKRHDSIINRLAHDPTKKAPEINTYVMFMMPDVELERSKFDNKDTAYLYNADKNRIFWNKFAAFLSGLLFCAGAARFANLNLPTLINNITSSNNYTNMGIMAGSAASFGLLLKHLQVPKEYK